jgi:hypothetical protein
VSGSNALYLLFYSSSVSPSSSSTRAGGFSVRPIWDGEGTPPSTITFNGLTYGVVQALDGKYWLDRNLGAKRVATAVNDSEAYGYYYQWGRGNDGHQFPTSATTTTLSSTDTPPSTGIDAERNTTIKYSGTASAKLIAYSTDAFTQNVNVGDTNSYTVSVYVYTDGSAVTSADLELYYNGSAVSTVYTSVGSGWYLLSATITGANESRTFGVEVKTGKTVYIDSFAITAGSGASTKLYITNSGTGEASLDVETDIKGQDIEAREITGSGRKKGIAIKTEAYTLTQTDDIVICDSDTDFTLTLPQATGDGQVFTIKNVNTATITIDGDGGTIDGNATLSLLEDESITIADYDTNSWIIT